MIGYRTWTFPVGSFQCNCTVLAHPETQDAIVIDPGDEPELIEDILNAEGLRVTALWHTHAHLDHVGATLRLLEWGTKRNQEEGKAAPRVFLHPGDKWLYDNVDKQSALLGLPPFEVTKTFDPITHGQTYEGFEGVKGLHTPGHTPGSCCLEIPQVSHSDFARGLGSVGESPFLISGDTLFRRSIGRTDLWGGDAKQIVSSIERRLFSLHEDTVVVPGHGPLTTIGEEKEKNPFF